VSKPLNGLVFLNTRPAEQLASLTLPLRELGGEVLELPCLALELSTPQVAASWLRLETALAESSVKHYLVFTSAYGIKSAVVNGALPGGRYRVPNLAVNLAVNLAASLVIGEGTASEARKSGLSVELVAEQTNSAGLASAIISQIDPLGSKLHLLRGELASPELSQALAEAGFGFESYLVYENSLPTVNAAFEANLSRAKKALLSGQVELVLFSSSQAVRNFFEIVGRDFAPLKVGAIGAKTSITAASYGCLVEVCPGRSSLDDFVAAIRVYCQR